MITLALVVMLMTSITSSAGRADCLPWFSEETQGWGEREESATTGITIFSKKGPDYDQFKGVMEINATQEALVNLLYNLEGETGECQKLFPKCKKARIISRSCEEVNEPFQNEEESYQYLEFKSELEISPIFAWFVNWFAKDRYVVLHRVFPKDDGKGVTELRLKAVPNICQEPELQRMKAQSTIWRFRSTEGITCVSYESYSDPDASRLGRQVVNSKLRSAVFETLKNMKCLRSEDQDWKKRNCKPV